MRGVASFSWVCLLAVVSGLAAFSASNMACAVDSRIVPDPLVANEQTATLKLVTARQAYQLLQSNPDMVLIDVRTFGETVFGGLPAPVRNHVPYVLIDEAHEFDAKNGRYRMIPNPDFPAAIAAIAKAHARGKEATLLLICSIGERSSKAAEYLTRLGYPNVYAVADGIDGDPEDQTKSALTGWRRAGLPWSGQLSASQAYKSPSF